jgi:hypothetical protein
LIPVSLGGSPRDVRNLWPEDRARATTEDRLEARLKGLVCTGALALTAAQSAIKKAKYESG